MTIPIDSHKPSNQRNLGLQRAQRHNRRSKPQAYHRQPRFPVEKVHVLVHPEKHAGPADALRILIEEYS